MAQFGYLDFFSTRFGVDETDSTWTNAVKEYQSFHGLNETGNLDNATLSEMSLPRCGMPDVIREENRTRSKRYTKFGTKWSKNNLTYRISEYTTQMRPSIVDEEIQRALNAWSQVADLTFTPKEQGFVDIEIKYVRRLSNRC